MTDELKAFRVLLVPLGLVVVFFVITPRMCSRKAPVSADQPTAPATTSSQAPAGLHIEGTPVKPVQAKESTFPPGLDSARIQYLVEIDSAFSTPATASFMKTWNGDEIQGALLRLNYIEKNADNSVTVTRDGAMNLNLTDNGSAFTFPIAKRAFDAVSYVSRIEDDKYDATISWHWDPNPMGNQLRVDARRAHSATAEFIGGPGGWVLSKWIASPDDARY